MTRITRRELTRLEQLLKTDEPMTCRDARVVSKTVRILRDRGVIGTGPRKLEELMEGAENAEGLDCVEFGTDDGLSR